MSPAEVKDLYKILGVGENAGKDEIKKAFRKLAVKYHPDKTKGNPEAEQRFKDINEAYQILSNDKKRQQYDFMRKNPFGGGFQPGGGGGGGFRFNMDDLGDLFGGGAGGFGSIFDFFSGAGAGGGPSSGMRTSPTRGADIQTSVAIPFLTAAKGGKQPIRIARKEICSRCGGSGAEPGTRQTSCPRCGGSGKVFLSQGGFGFSRPCPECMGSGAKITKPCRECHGTGTQSRTKTLHVKIPAGIKDGQKIRLAGEGEPGPHGGPSGDLYIQIHVGEHPSFKRDGDVVYSEKEIDLALAVLGGKVKVETLQGPVTLKIPPGTQSGTKFKLKGRGVPAKRGRMGDHYVKVRVRVPNRLSSEQKKRFESFAASLNNGK